VSFCREHLLFDSLYDINNNCSFRANLEVNVVVDSPLMSPAIDLSSPGIDQPSSIVVPLQSMDFCNNSTESIQIRACDIFNDLSSEASLLPTIAPELMSVGDPETLSNHQFTLDNDHTSACNAALYAEIVSGIIKSMPDYLEMSEMDISEIVVKERAGSDAKTIKTSFDEMTRTMMLENCEMEVPARLLPSMAGVKLSNCKLKVLPQ
jgi:hypothetical protein